MKMPRSQCEAGNVQFVQELAEVDGPFEAPININFRDLTKLELPPLAWNKSDTSPRKMKITNTGHTVIVSAKWKCERPYLTGGPLIGKYVFSQIHFHWGQTDCRGSEHQICGEQFPLEMHVAHFKTEYMTQESALREKDGMVVVVYLFKLQEEPNHSLKRIINSLPHVKQPSTSCAIDPRPIVSLCHPFTEDYFMYWGSVVTSTCAHILLWLICREPFGISKDQVSEFRKIMDSSQKPICKNSREVQPLHKRNVFHVNASKYLDNPLLPIKKRLGCYCKESKEAFNTSNSCHCHGAYQNQEDVEGHFHERADFEGIQTGHSCFANQTFVVQTATMRSLSIVLKRAGSDPIKNHCSLENLKKVKSEVYNQQVKLVSKSSCIFPAVETKKINNLNEKRKIREKNKLFTSVNAFSQIMHSLEVLKNQTFKKLKKIESINQEIKQMKPFCQDTEDKRWIRKIEKMIMKQKRFTIKRSQGCLNELKKLAKDCNFDKYFDSKALPADANNRKMVWLSNNMIATAELPCCENPIEGLEENHGVENKSSRHSDIGKTIKFSSKAQKLIESFFEDIKDNDDLQETMTNDPNFKKIKSLCTVAGDSKSVSAKNKGYITQKMFNLGNLGDRFFTEITTENMNLEENWKFEEQNVEVAIAQDINETKNVLDCFESEKLTETSIERKPVIPLHRVIIPISLSKAKDEETEAVETVIGQNASLKEEKNQKISLKKASKKIHLKKSSNENEEQFYEVRDEILTIGMQKTNMAPSKSQTSSLNLSTDSIDTQKITSKKIQQSKKNISEQNKKKSSVVFKVSSKKLHIKTSCKKLESVQKQKKTAKIKEKKNPKDENLRNKSALSSASKEEANGVLNKAGEEGKVKTKLQAETVSTKDFATKNPLINAEKKKLTARSSKESTPVKINKNVFLTTTETRTIIPDASSKYQKICEELLKAKQENSKKFESTQKVLKEIFSEEQQSVTSDSTRNESRTVSKTLTNKTYRASSADSKTNNSNAKALKESENNQCDLRLKSTTLKIDTSKPLLKTSCRSLTDISIKQKPDFAQRLQLESIDSRKKTNQDVRIKKLKDGYKILKESPREAANELLENLREEEGEAIQAFEKSHNSPKYDIKVPTENSTQVKEEFLSKAQVQNEKDTIITLKRQSKRKKQFQEKIKKESFEILRLTDSDKSFARPTSIGIADFLAPENKNFHTSVSCSILKKNSTSRSHSAETLHSLKKTQKRKGKKRPHCSKIGSRHYIRKNFSVFKKPSKSFNFLSLTNEEQLKIISVNVANYIKQKLLDEKRLEIEVNSPIDAEKDSRVLSTPERKSEEPPTQETSKVPQQRTKKFKIPVLKSKEKEKEKEIKNIKKPSTAESQSETNKQKVELYTSARPVNNFIKLNKQMAGTYKRAVPTNSKKTESKEREKSNLGTKQTDKILKPKTKAQKKTKEKDNAPLPKDVSNQKRQTLSSPTTELPSPKKVTQKEKQLKSPTTCRKPESNTKKTKKAQTTSPKAEKPSESIEVKGKSDVEKTQNPSTDSKETPRTKKSSVSACNFDSNSRTPETAENSNEKSFQNEVIKIEAKSKVEDETKSEVMFKKELEYFITMQMFLNSEISKGTENPLQFFNPNLLCSGNATENLFGEEYLENREFFNKDVVVVQKKSLEECLSSCSELTEIPAKFIQEKDSADEKNEISPRNKNILTVKAPKEFHDINRINSTPGQEGSEDSPSDSSYDCKISITLNTNLKAKEAEPEPELEPEPEPEPEPENENERQDYEAYCLEDNCISQTTTSLEESSSHLTTIKPENKKKESDMSLEMKQKLLEILEGEIKREIGISCGVSSGPSSDGFVFKAGDSDGNSRSQSTESSSDNMETLAQISTTMRQYLTYLKQMKQLPDENKGYEEF